MKIVLATPLYPPDTGGPATDAAQLVRELPAQGIDVLICSFGSVRHLPRIIRHVRYTYKLYKVCRGKSSDSVDVIVAMDTFSVCLPAMIVARFMGKKFVVRVPGDFAWEQATRRFGVTDTIEIFQKKRYGWNVEMMRSLQRFAVCRADLVVCCSDFLKGIVAEWGVSPERLTRIYLGMDITEEIVMPRDVPNGKILFSLGRFVPWKGFVMLIDVVPMLPSDWHFVIAGEGPLRSVLESQALERGVSNRITFTGALPHAEVLGWLRAADAFALNTSYETFSFQVLEAMASGTPVITTNAGSLPELITNGVEGTACSPNDAAAFTDAILSTQTDSEEWKKRTERAVQKAHTFSAEASTRAFAGALTTLCA